MLYRSGRSNLALTIFVPYDCHNHCPFCTSKEMYNNKLMTMKYAIKQIKKISKVKAIKDIVFTGGEPFANLELLQTLIDVAYYESKKNIYINTSMPNADFINKNRKKITGVSVSRHIKVVTNECFDYQLSKIDVPLRINSVLYKISEKDIDRIKNFIDKYEDYQINFREDYTLTNVSNLKNVTDNYFIDILANKLNYTYLYGGGCQVCNDDVFENNIHYHRGLQYSSFVVGQTTVVNDIIIFPTGEICYDWDISKKVTDKVLDDLDVDFTTLTKPVIKPKIIYEYHYVSDATCGGSGCGSIRESWCGSGRRSGCG